MALHLILAATDGSDGAGRAIAVAAAIAAACGARLHIVTVEEASVQNRAEMRRFAEIEGGIGEAAEFVAENVLHDAREAAERQGVKAVETEVYWGKAAQAISEGANRLNPDLVVVGRRGRGKLASLMLGSVSKDLVNTATRPVLVVP